MRKPMWDYEFKLKILFIQSNINSCVIKLISNSITTAKTFFKNIQLRAGKVAQAVRAPAQQHEPLSSNPILPKKSVCGPSIMKKKLLRKQ
jgi:hypothetical protein